MSDMPAKGESAPDFEMPSTQGMLRLHDLTATKKVVLAFYTEDNTPLCAAEVSVFQEDHELLHGLEAEVVAVSADNLDSHKDFSESLGGGPLPLGSDENPEGVPGCGGVGGSRNR